MARALVIHSDFAAADDSNCDYYASLKPEERLEILLELNQRYLESQGETTEGFARVYTINELPRR